MLKTRRTFRGGYWFRNFAHQPKGILIDAALPKRVHIPLRQGFGMELMPLVKKGDRVGAGQIIGQNEKGISTPVHASVSGIVEDIRRVNYFKRDVAMITIVADQVQEIQLLKNRGPGWEKLDNASLEKILYLSGVTSLDREGIPTRFHSSVIMPEDVENLIVHGVGSEPYNISLDVLLSGKRLLHFVEGLRILKKILPRAKVYLALNATKTKLIEEINKMTAAYEWLGIYPLEPKYPQGYDEVLIPTLLNKKFPYGYSAANMGAVVLNIQVILAVYDAVVEGRPLIERIIALCGQGFKENIHLKVRVGTPLCDVLNKYIFESGSLRVVSNSLLTGLNLNDWSLPIDRTFSQIIAVPDNREREFLSFLRPGLRLDSYSHTFFSSLVPGVKKKTETNLHGEERPCISCNYCEEVCPVDIIPHLLSKYVKKEIIDETLMNYEIFNCIQCGLCSYVCPSKIPLARIIKDGQDKLIMQGCDQSQCILPYFNLKGIEEYRGVKEL
jgi:Na(+)-translocating NADH:ubiquinone oxidoreductase A subunit